MLKGIHMIIRVKKLLSLRARLLRHGENKQGDCGTAVGVHAGVCNVHSGAGARNV